jgi:DNA-binding NarL/FixJ family response regulator
MGQIMMHREGAVRKGSVSLLLAEPSSMLREKIAGILGRHERVWCVIQVSNEAELVRAAAQNHPDFVLADVALVRSADLVEVLKWVSHRSRVYALVDVSSEPYERLVEQYRLSGLLERSRVEEHIAREIDLLSVAREAH